VVRAGGSLIYELVHIRTYTEIGNDIGLPGNPTAFISGCTVTPYGDQSGSSGFQLAAGDADNCTGTIGGTRVGGSFLTPGGTNNNGSVSWSASDNTIGALTWDAPAGGTIYPSAATSPLSCASNLAFRVNAATNTARESSPCPVVTVHPDLVTPYVVAWNLSIQRAITNNVVLDVAYVGNHGTKFISHVDLNQPDPANNFWGQTISSLTSDDTGPGGLVATYGGQTFAQSCFSELDTGFCDGSTLSFNLFQNRPYNSKFPYLLTINQLGNADWSNYNALQISLTTRNFHGLSMVSGYTFG
jgi:hypothetical protein